MTYRVAARTSHRTGNSAARSRRAPVLTPMPRPGSPHAAQKAHPGTARPVPLVPEVADAGEDHGDPQAVCRRHHFRIAHAPARLNEGGGAVLYRFLDAIGEGEERVGSDHRSGEG